MSTKRFPLLDDRQWLLDQVNAGRSTRQIADDVGCATSSVLVATQRLGLSGIRGRQRPEQRNAALANREWLLARVERGLLLIEIAAQAQASTSSVKTWLARHQIHRAPRTPNPLLADRDWLAGQIDQGCSVREIAKRADVSSSTVSTWQRRHGLVDRQKTEQYAVLSDRGWLVDRLAKGESRTSIARGLGCSAERVGAAVRHFGLRTTSEASKEQRSAAVQRHVDGETVTSVARSIGRKPATVTKWVREHGKEPDLQGYSRGQKRDLLALLNNGRSVAEVARCHGVDPTTLRAWRRRAQKATTHGEVWP